MSDIYLSGFETFDRLQADLDADGLDGLEGTLDRIAAQPRLARERLEFMPPVRLHPDRSQLISPDETVIIIRILPARQDRARLLS